MSFFARLAEAKIQEGIERGEFDNLPGAGRPPELEDLSHIPPHLRLGYKILRNAGVVPPEVELRRELFALDREIDGTRDPQTLSELRRRRRESDLRLAILMDRRAAAAGPGAVRALRQRRTGRALYGA